MTEQWHLHFLKCILYSCYLFHANSSEAFDWGHQFIRFHSNYCFWKVSLEWAFTAHGLVEVVKPSSHQVTKSTWRIDELRFVPRVRKSSCGFKEQRWWTVHLGIHCGRPSNSTFDVHRHFSQVTHAELRQVLFWFGRRACCACCAPFLFPVASRGHDVWAWSAEKRNKGEQTMLFNLLIRAPSFLKNVTGCFWQVICYLKDDQARCKRMIPESCVWIRCKSWTQAEFLESDRLKALEQWKKNTCADQTSQTFRLSSRSSSWSIRLSLAFPSICAWSIGRSLKCRVSLRHSTQTDSLQRVRKKRSRWRKTRPTRPQRKEEKLKA